MAWQMKVWALLHVDEGMHEDSGTKKREALGVSNMHDFRQTINWLGESDLFAITIDPTTDCHSSTSVMQHGI